MGAYLATPMKEGMLQAQQMQIERQVAMQDAMRERQMAFMVARQREMLNWTGSFAVLVSTLCVLGFAKTKHPAALFPTIPMGFGFGYMYDMAYGDKLIRICNDAEDIIKNEPKILNLPKGPPTFAELDARRDKNK